MPKELNSKSYTASSVVSELKQLLACMILYAGAQHGIRGAKPLYQPPASRLSRYEQDEEV